MPLLHASLLHGYRAFLAKLSSRGYLDDASRRPRRNSKLLIRLRARTLLNRTGWNPWRAVHRLKEKATRLREYKRETLTLRHVFRRAPERKPIQHPEMQELFGQDGILRVHLSHRDQMDQLNSRLPVIDVVDFGSGRHQQTLYVIRQ